MEVGGSRWLYHVGRSLKFRICMQYTIYVFCILYGDDARYLLRPTIKNFLDIHYISLII